MYTQEQLEKALALHTRLVGSGLDPDYAELRVLRALDRGESEAIEEVAQAIVDGAEDRWKERQDRTGKDNFFDELRRRIEAERAAQRSRGPAARQRLEGRS